MSREPKRPSLRVASAFNEDDYKFQLKIPFSVAVSNDETETVYTFVTSDNSQPKTLADIKNRLIEAMKIGRAPNYHLKEETSLIHAWFKNETDQLLAIAAMNPGEPCSMIVPHTENADADLSKLRRTAKNLQKLFSAEGYPNIAFSADWPSRSVKAQAKTGMDLIQFVGRMRDHIQEYKAEMR